MEVFYTDIIHGDSYTLYLDLIGDKEYLYQSGVLWETKEAGEIKLNSIPKVHFNKREQY